MKSPHGTDWDMLWAILSLLSGVLLLLGLAVAGC